MYNGKDSSGAQYVGMFLISAVRPGGISSAVWGLKLAPLSLQTEFRMDVMKVLAELRQERQQLEEAILTLERLARSRGKRRGRPPAWMSQGAVAAASVATAGEPKRRGRPPGSKNKQVTASA